VAAIANLAGKRADQFQKKMSGRLWVFRTFRFGAPKQNFRITWLLRCHLKSC